MRRFLLALAIGLSAVLVFPQVSSAHVERPSYWPVPTADCSVSPCAGGAVPKIRTLRSALDKKAVGNTRVVCKSNSVTLVKRAINRAVAKGYNVRPTDHRKLSAASGRALLKTNKALFKQCRYHQIQAAVTASRNNDRVVVMPGLYTEPTSRSKPTYDKSCAQYHTKSDGGDPGALSHEYQIMCPNDANLIAVIGRDRGKGIAGDPKTPLVDRHGIPNPGKCIRCNFQLEGSGVSADDVIIEAGDASKGNGGPSAVGHKKDVGIFADRADGFVLRNMTVRHAREHDIYVVETDGYVLDRFKTYYAGAYGVLTFVGDHGLIQNCEAVGNGDSGLYPGSGAQTLVDRKVSFYPTARYSQTIRWCDSHHNTSGFSGTNSHGTRIIQNNFYDNALGYTTDVFTAAGHPGFPQSGNVVEENNFYSNNFNPYKPGSDVSPFIPAPVGTGLWLAGGNDNVVRNNRFFDNWRRGTMLFAVPDATVCGPILGDTKTPIPGCKIAGISTSYGNDQYGNKMGVAPSGAVKPNGLDFWWDSFPGNTGNCFWGNTAAPGKKVTSNPGSLPNCSNGTKPNTSIGLGNLTGEVELLACLAGLQLGKYPGGTDAICSWSKTPAKPGSAAARTSASSAAAETTANQKQVFTDFCAAGLGKRTCKPYKSQYSGLSILNDLVSALTPPKVAPAPKSNKPLSLYTCGWWRKANPAQKAELVNRLEHFVSGSVDGDKRVGYGATLQPAQAAALFDGRCSTSYAGAFALYKLYGAAAAFTAANS
ncbi:hypothetical protein EFK50_07945 [Nocardioides marmoriginsengisoli]|uniref:Right handed beta helix domain-containing protein n=1 Tax=Nocardioides marmoriginsengisoli TaxID=661483 RepID=A0A3N0CKW8_9ACTN|nr:right-handed parallel beta-helix repeat-containing protein [Nocardioides marmoriginsengisoli]RNL63666.1 hypothetical protein EFK50_07945 [Nocardioides marmoriginsengisoli]